jgi:hypothetical protein
VCRRLAFRARELLTKQENCLQKFLCDCSSFAKYPRSYVKEPPLASDLEVFQDNPGHLHRFVSEGDVSGVRSV